MNDDFVNAEQPQPVPSAQPNILEALQEIEQRLAFRRPSSSVDLHVLRGRAERASRPHAAWWLVAAAMALGIVAISRNEPVSSAAYGGVGSQFEFGDERPTRDLQIEVPTREAGGDLATPIDLRPRDTTPQGPVDVPSVPRLVTSAPEVLSPWIPRSAPRQRSAPVRNSSSPTSIDDRGERRDVSRRASSPSPTAPRVIQPSLQPDRPSPRPPSPSKSGSTGSTGAGAGETGAGETGSDDTSAERTHGVEDANTDPGQSRDESRFEEDSVESFDDSIEVVDCAGLDGTGAYHAYYCGQEDPFFSSESLSCVEAHDNCQINARANPTLSFLCTWNGAIVFVAERQADACADLAEAQELD